MNSTPNRFGNPAPGVVSAKAGSDSSHGRAMVTPAPRSTVRREMRLADCGFPTGILFTFLSLGIQASFVEELRTRNDEVHDRREPVTARHQSGLHSLDQRLIGELQRAAET